MAATDFTSAGKVCATKGLLLGEAAGLQCYEDLGEYSDMIGSLNNIQLTSIILLQYITSTCHRFDT